MKITIRERRTVGEILDQVQRRYGTRAKLRAYVKAHPHDVMAKVALHDLEEYRTDDPGKVIQETREVIIPESAIDQLTIQRLHLLLTLRGLHGSVRSIRALARTLNRDIKNVSEDVRVLRELGLIHVEHTGRGRASRISLPGDQIDLHLVEAEA